MWAINIGRIYEIIVINTPNNVERQCRWLYIYVLDVCRGMNMATSELNQELSIAEELSMFEGGIRGFLDVYDAP